MTDTPTTTVLPPRPHGELCGERALGCGPCQLIKGHKPEHRHLCDHYARGGVEFHDPQDRYCRCPDCELKRLHDQFDQAVKHLEAAERRVEEARAATTAHVDRFGPFPNVIGGAHWPRPPESAPL